MSLLLLLACLCGAAARGAPTARCLPESELEGYCRSRRLDGPAPGYKPTKKPSGPAPQCEDFGADVVDTATGESFCERSGLDDEASCTACGTCCEWDGSRCNYWIERETSSGPNKDCPRTGGAQYVPIGGEPASTDDGKMLEKIWSCPVPLTNHPEKVFFLRILSCVPRTVNGTGQSTDDDDDDDDSLVSGKEVLPSPGWDTCDWIESNLNSYEYEVGRAKSPWQCIAMVREQYPDATIANIRDSGAGSCYAQYGSTLSKDKSGWKSCLLTSQTARDLPGLNATPHFSADGVFIANDVTIRRAVSLWSSNRTDDESARIKGFKPGTNAQRHRLYRIQHSRRASSRLADLTSMVRDSFRRVNVVSESSGDEKEPAAARPAARPQLSWRASAPEYGTFES